MPPQRLRAESGYPRALRVDLNRRTPLSVSARKRNRPSPAPEPPAPAVRPAVRHLAPLVSLLLAVGIAGAWWWFTLAKAPSTPPPSAQAPASPPPVPAAYVDNQLCLGCHQDQGRQWQQSHHAQAMAAPTEQTVRGDFNNTVFKHQGVTTRFFKRGDKFMVRTDGPDGKLADFEVSYTFGVAPLQQYLIGLPGGRLQPLQIAWDSERRRWFHLLPHEKAPAGDVLHWTGRYQTGNTMCIGCHTTGFEKRYDAAADTFASRWSEPNVSCQSCHGPGQRHVQWAQGRQQGQAAPDLAGERHGLPINLSKMGGAQQVEGVRPATRGAASSRLRMCRASRGSTTSRPAC